MAQMPSIKNLISRTIRYAILRTRIVLSPTLLEYAPEGWQTVLKQTHGSGWNAESVVKAETAKWEEFCARVTSPNPLGFNHEHDDMTIDDQVMFHNINITFGYVLALAAHRKTQLSLLDYGGGLGHFYHIGKSLLPDIELDFSCKEMPAIAARGTTLNPGVRWYTDDSCLKKSYDLVMISGSLQYMENWQQFLQSIAPAAGNFLYITRVAVQSTSPSFVAVQYAYETQMLHWLFNREELLQVVLDNGFSLIREFIQEECPLIRNAPAQCVMRGWLFRKIIGEDRSEDE